MPVSWRWHYWACPVAWTLYGLVASQFGNLQNRLENEQTVEEFVREYYGYRHDFVVVVAGVILGITLLFAFTFGISIRSFNFQRR